MKIYETAVRKPVTTALIFIGIVVFGLFSFTRLSVDLYPEIELNAVTIMTTYSGASATDIEQNVTKRLEMSLSTVSDLKRISSTSKDNISLITIEFEYGTDMDEAVNDIRTVLDMQRNFLPEDTENPVVLKFNSSMMPVAFMSARTSQNEQGLYKILEEKVANPINRINGVASVSISGAPQREIQVRVDPKKMEAYKLSIEQISGLLAMENRNMPAGNIDIGSETFSVRVDGEFKSSDQIGDIIVGSFMGRNIYIKDVATVKDTLKERATEVLTNGERSAMIVIQKQSGSNVVEIVDRINKELPAIKAALPADVQLEMVLDTSDFIKSSINSLTETVLLAGLFVMIVVLFFLGRWRATFIIILTIPVSLIAAFIYLMITGNTLNIISLSSLSIAIGMVVDDAIVVLENITSHIEKGSKPRDAAIYATNEVAVAVVASTLTIVAVFFPLTMVTGLAGIMFKQLGWIVTIIITVSTVAALTLTPMLSSRMLKKDPKRSKAFMFFYSPIERGLDSLDEWYAGLLRWAVSNRKFVLIASFALFLSSIMLLTKVGTDFFPTSDNAQISIKVELPVGTRVEQARVLNEYLYSQWKEKYPEIEVLQTSMGQSDGSNIFMSLNSSGSHLITYTARLSKAGERKRDIFEISDLIREELKVIPELYRFEVIPGGSNPGMGTGGSGLELDVLGYNMDDAAVVAEQVAEIMRKTPGLRDVKLSREDFMPQLRVEFDRAKLAMNGINLTSAANVVRNRINGIITTRFREDGEEYDIVVRNDISHRTSIEDINEILLYNNTGKSVRLSEVGTVNEDFAPPSIEHLDRERVIKVTGSIYKRALGDIAKEVTAEVDKMTLPANIAVELSGSYEEQQDSFADMLTLLLLVVMLTYIVMAAQFESFRDPFIIMFSLPFAFTGVFVALWLTGTSLSLIALIGAVMLVGIVVKNGIVLIDYINLNKERGMSVMRSVVSGGRSRLRPVLMTTITTILGMLPMAIGIGEGSEIWQPMGISIIGGLTLSTILTLVVIPTVYTSFHAGDIKRKRRAHAKLNS
ncbi:MAG: multidrug transporter AcrB [Bacteroidetes bacterium GWF2_41_61]|nr:MAG: multidrug transporter AcrB [Bacteroidetes bacterium GWF2_41_61]OFY88128.1 MAG: multidrug transporter AcrB [Bacteroidetes bacterium RIFOXYA12_FULL_40_10]HBG25451.1 multidrug transporter AcrB [Rikenellaceae bacterium]